MWSLPEGISPATNAWLPIASSGLQPRNLSHAVTQFYNEAYSQSCRSRLNVPILTTSAGKKVASNLVPQRTFLKGEAAAALHGSFCFCRTVDTLPSRPAARLMNASLPPPGQRLFEAFVAPCTLVEEKLAQIWAEVLEIEQVRDRSEQLLLNWGHSSLTVSTTLRC